MADLWTTVLDVAIQVLTLVLGILGAVAFYWQYGQRRARRVRFLNRAVAKPWSKVEAKHRFRSVDGRAPSAIRFAIPAEAAKDLDPTVGTDGLDIERLPGALDDGLLRSLPLSRLSRMERALRAECRRAVREWDLVEECRKKYEGARERRRSILEPRIMRDLQSAYPRLRPVGPHEVSLNAYVPAHILAAAEDESDWSTRPGYHRVPYETSRSSDGRGTFIQEISRSYIMLRASEQVVADASVFNRLFASWVDASDVAGLAREMEGRLSDLDTVISQFRGTMTTLTFRLDLEFPPED